MLRLGTIVLTVEDLPRALAFWCAALGYAPRSEPGDDWAILDPPGAPAGGGAVPGLALSVTGYPRAYPPRLHLDLYADDQAAEIERLLALGAREVDWDRYPPDADWVVLEDPDGNRFCVIDASAE